MKITFVNDFLAMAKDICQSLHLMPETESSFAGRSDQELLKTLLRSDKNATVLAQQFSLESLPGFSRRELGLSQSAYDRLMAGIELGRRVQEAKANYKVSSKIDSSSKAIEFCQVHFARLISDSLQEQFHVVTLNTKNYVIDTHRITVGTLDASLVHPREVFRRAIRDAASRIILAHNHPSGDPTPSSEDFAVTSRLEKAGTLIGIDVLDHIVMGREGLVSIKEC